MTDGRATIDIAVPARARRCAWRRLKKLIDCDALWTRLVTAVYKVRRLPRVTNDPPPLKTK